MASGWAASGVSLRAVFPGQSASYPHIFTFNPEIVGIPQQDTLHLRLRARDPAQMSFSL